MASKLVEETAEDRRLVFEYAVEEAVNRAIDSFFAKTEGRALELRRLEAAAAAARLQRAGDNPAAWWPAVLPYAPPTATAGELERMDESLESDVRQFHSDLSALRSAVCDRYNLCNRELRVASRAPGVTDALIRRRSSYGALTSIERVKREPRSAEMNGSVHNIDKYRDVTEYTIKSLDQNPRLTWVETEIGLPVTRPDKEAERTRMNAQVAGGAPADQPPGYTP